MYFQILLRNLLRFWRKIFLFYLSPYKNCITLQSVLKGIVWAPEQQMWTTAASVCRQCLEPAVRWSNHAGTHCTSLQTQRKRKLDLHRLYCWYSWINIRDEGRGRKQMPMRNLCFVGNTYINNMWCFFTYVLGFYLM